MNIDADATTMTNLCSRAYVERLALLGREACPKKATRPYTCTASATSRTPIWCGYIGAACQLHDSLSHYHASVQCELFEGIDHPGRNINSRWENSVAGRSKGERVHHARNHSVASSYWLHEILIVYPTIYGIQVGASSLPSAHTRGSTWCRHSRRPENHILCAHGLKTIDSNS